jgi:hypothetical protein
MANTFLTPSVIARESLMLLESNMVVAQLVNRGIQDDFTAAKRGDTITVRNRANFVVDEYAGSTITVQDASEAAVPVVLEKHFDVSFTVTDKQMTLDIVSFSEQLLEPAMLAIAEGIDAYVLQKAVEESWSTMGTAGDPPDTLADLALLDRTQNDLKVPIRGRNYIMNPLAKQDLYNIANFTDADKRGDDGTALREASLGRFMGYDMFMAQNVHNFTAGTLTAVVTVTGANAIGATTINLTTDATGDFDLNPGDILTFAGDLQPYVMTSSTGAVGNLSSGNVTISPALKIATSGTEVVTQVNATSHAGNIAFHPRGIVLAAVPLALPRGAAAAAIIQNRGFGIRAVWAWDKDTKADVISLDILVGAKVQHPELLTRVLG